jgi:CBS domain-containing protein
VAHLRIENRALPAGPTIVDEIANAAFFAGLMLSLPQEYGDIAKRMNFDDAKSNFFRAARHGLDAQFNWIDGKSHTASSLVLDHLLPLARQGLANASVDRSDVDTYLGIIEERVRSRQTGARWILKSIEGMQDVAPKDISQRRLTAAMLSYQKQGNPVHRWPLIKVSDTDDWEQGYRTVGQFMSTDLFTVQPDDLIDLAASVMDWRHVRHVPVEDEGGRLVGLVTHRGLLHLLSTRRELGAITVKEIMVPNPLTVSPSTPTLEGIAMMREHRVGCLPVVEGDQLVGIVTSYDFLEASARLFQEHLGRTTESFEPAKSRAMTQSA